MVRNAKAPQPKRRPQQKKAAAPPRRRNPTRALPKLRATPSHLLSPLTRGLVPTLAFQGEAFPYTGVIRQEITPATTNKLIVIATNTGVSGTCLMELRWDATATSTNLIGVKNVYTIPTLALGDDAGGPTSLRAMKAGLTIVNRTPLLNRGGPVYTLNLNQRIRAAKPPSTMTIADADALFATLSGHPDATSMDGVDFGKARHMYSHVVDDPAYNNFDQNRGTLTADEFFTHLAITSGSGVTDRPMSTMVFLLDRCSVAQTFQFSAHASFYSRWPLDTVPGQANRKIPHQTHAQHNKMHSEASQHAKGPPDFVSDVESAAKRFGKDAETVASDIGRAMYRRGRAGMLPRAP